MRADLAAAVARRKAQAIEDPAERIAALRAEVERTEVDGDLAAFIAALVAYEAACLKNPGAEREPAKEVAA